MFTFVQEIEHVDFVGAVEQLAAKAGIQLTLHRPAARRKDRQRRKRLVEAMGKAVEWYHQRLLDGADARTARDYLRTPRPRRRRRPPVQARAGRPTTGTRSAASSGLPADAAARHRPGVHATRRDRMQDAFRARVMFPIFIENGDAVAFGGRILPGLDRPGEVQELAGDADLRQVEDAVRPELGQGRHRRRRPGDRVRGLHRRHRLPPGRRASGPWPRAARRSPRSTCGCSSASPAGSCWRSTPTPPARAPPSASTSGSRSTRCRSAWPRFPKGKDPGELASADPDGVGRRGRRGVAVPRLPPAAGDERPRRCARRRIARASPSRRWRWSTSIPTSTCASCTPARSRVTPVCRSTTWSPSPHGGSARPIVRVVAGRRVGSAENAEFVAIALLCSAGTRSPAGSTKCCSSTMSAAPRVPGGRRGRRVGRTVARAGRSRGPRADRAGRGRRHRRRSGGRGPQPHRRRCAPRTGPHESTKPIRWRSSPTATLGVALEQFDEPSVGERCSRAVARVAATAQRGA